MRVLLFALALLAGVPHTARGGPRDAYRVLPWRADAVSGERAASTRRVAVPGASWLRLAFGEVVLPAGSFVRIRSTLDGGEQRLGAEAMADWSRSSAFFNGGEVEVELVDGGSDSVARVEIRAVFAGEPPALSPQTICGPVDDRVPSGDNRVGRIRPGGCTAWRIGNGALLTAGHCVDFDPDGTGPQLPDGIVDLAGVVEFNVPASDSLGTLVASAPEDQYPIDTNGIQWRYDGDGMGFGKDWAVFRVGANANTGLAPHQAYGPPFRITRELPDMAMTVRVTGFGVDAGAANQTNQTHTGPFGAEAAIGPDIWLRHFVDTMGGNSGSPVLWEALNLAIGIHTNGGCTAAGGENVGTSFEVDALENAINGFPGANTFYVDADHPLPIVEVGTLMRPWNTLQEGIAGVPAGGTLMVFPGTVPLPSGTTVTKAMTLRAPVGVVDVVGN